MNIELPPAVGIIPTFEVDYETDLREIRYKPLIKVVGSYEDRGYGYEPRSKTYERDVWVGDDAYDYEEQAVVASVNKLVDMLGGLG